MSAALRSLIHSGTKLWLDSIDPDLVVENFRLGATGATSNPIIVADLLKSGRFDDRLRELSSTGRSDSEVAWQMTAELVGAAEQVFLPVWQQTDGNDGYVSFELDPLLEDPELDLPHAERVAEYIASGKRWSVGHPNRMIKVPATPAGLDSLEELAAAGVPLNVTLIFSARQHRAACEAVWRGLQRNPQRSSYKSVYSIFVSRIDVYTQQQVPNLSPAAQGLVGIVNAQRLWSANRNFWSGKSLPLDQEIIFASTGTKDPREPAWKYVSALAGSDIQTNPPATNAAVAASSEKFSRRVDALPAAEVLAEIDRLVNFDLLEQTLMAQGIEKFATPQHQLLRLIQSKRAELVA
ncbi:MAG: transaldolase family protein [Planctomycetota bacterium]